MLTLATRAFPQLPDVHAQAIPRLCYGAEDREAGLYTLDGQPKTMEEAVDHMQYFQHSRQSRPPKPKREAVRSMADKDKVSVDSQKDGEGESEIKELRSRCSSLRIEGEWQGPSRPDASVAATSSTRRAGGTQS